MRRSRSLLIVLGLTLMAWVGLALWREAGIRQMRTIEEAYLDHYREHPTDAAVMEWDFEQQKLLETPDSAVQRLEGSGGLQAVGVRVPEEDPLISAYGLVLARVPAWAVHGVFGLLVLLLSARLLTKK